jgi:4-hydroxybenzoate polyprenyltransferase
MTAAADGVSRGTVGAWLKLLRLPNHATAVADVLAGWLIIARPDVVATPPAAFWGVAVASLLLYASGMVLNDVFDRELDAVERPERPLPSGQISPWAAGCVGWLLMAAGIAAGVSSAVLSGNTETALVVAALALAIVLYDARAKSTAAGPWVMGTCRGLNWLLGVTAAGGVSANPEWLPAIGMGIYVVGITLFARTEATRSSRGMLSLATAVMSGGLAVAAGYVVWLAGEGGSAWLIRAGLDNWLLLWGVLAASVVYRAIRGIVTPEPALVQRAVGNAIMTIITLDASLVLAACGEPWGIVAFMLLAPFLVGRRFIPPT